MLLSDLAWYKPEGVAKHVRLLVLAFGCYPHVFTVLEVFMVFRKVRSRLVFSMLFGALWN